MSGYKILVTGGAGFLGQRIVGELLTDQALFPLEELRILDIRDYLGISDQRIKMIQGDIGDEKIVEHACEGVDAVIHTAAMVDWGTRRPSGPGQGFHVWLRDPDDRGKQPFRGGLGHVRRPLRRFQRPRGLALRHEIPALLMAPRRL